VIILIIKKGGENKVKKGVENLTGKKITKNKDKTNDRLFRYDINKDFDDVESFKISERIYKIGNGLKTL